MHTTIYKYTLPIEMQEFEITMPKNSSILKMGLDGGGNPCIWALVVVGDSAPLINRRFYCVGTGWRLDDIFEGEPVIYIDSVTDRMGLVWHLFEAKETQV